jgi:hypothetical protein
MTSPTTQAPPWYIQTLNAGLSMIPMGYAFNAKTAQQLGKVVLRTTLQQKCIQGLQLAPYSAGIVGTQLGVQNYWGTLAVAAISPFPLAMLNGRTMGYTWRESLRRLCIWQYTACTAREALFLGSMVVSGPLGKKVQEKSGKNQAVAAATTFATVGVGSACGQAADTAFTRWQKGLSIDRSMLWRGLGYRTWANAGFGTILQTLNYVTGVLCQHK